MRIHLVTPRNRPSFWTYDSVLPTLGRCCTVPNLSMPTVAGITPPGHEVTLCDENVEDLSFEVEADIVGVTGYLVHRERMLEVIDGFRQRGHFVVVGGPYATLCPDELRGRCDVLFLGEAEDTWPRFLRDFEVGAWEAEYRAPRPPDLTRSPAPRFDLMKLDRYQLTAIQFARGCPFRCEFCDIIVLYGRRPRTKSVPQVLHEIETCWRLGARQIFIVDDNFIGNRKLAKELLRAIVGWQQERGYPLDFNTEVSLNVADDEELLELLHAARFVSVFVGIETPRAASLHETGKIQNTRSDMVESVHRIQRHGINVQAGMIVGFDNDDSAIFEEQLRFIQDAHIPVSMTGMLQALPGTALTQRMAEEGRLLSGKEREGDPFCYSNIVPKRMTRQQLYAGYLRLLRALYTFDNYLERTVAFLRRRGPHVGPRWRLRRGDLRLGLRILRDLTLRAGLRRARFTLSLVGRVALRRPWMLPEVLTFAVLHKAMRDYVEQLTPHLEQAIAALGSLPTQERDLEARVQQRRIASG